MLADVVELFSSPLSRLLGAVFGGLDPQETYSVAVLEIEPGLPEGAIEQTVSAHRGACHRLATSVVMGVFGGMPNDAVRCATALDAQAREHGGTVRGAIHRGLMRDRVSDFVEHVPKVAAELAELALPGQILLTNTVLDPLTDGAGAETAFVDLIVVRGSMLGVFELSDRRNTQGDDNPTT
jgi:class 3 adenylate cyclase